MHELNGKAGAGSSPGIRTRETKPAPAPTAGLRSLGNRQVGRMIRAKLEVGAVDDPLEREADRAAERAMGMISPPPMAPSGPPAGAASPVPANTVTVRRRCAQCEEEEARLGMLRAKAAPGTAPSAASPLGSPPAVHQALQSPGRPLDPPARAFLEPRLGADFSDARVHVGAIADHSARQINALAYTVGSHIVFAANQYAPETRDGRKLLAHELAHVAQNRSGGADRHRPLRQSSLPEVETVFEGDNGVVLMVNGSVLGRFTGAGITNLDTDVSRMGERSSSFRISIRVTHGPESPVEFHPIPSYAGMARILRDMGVEEFSLDVGPAVPPLVANLEGGSGSVPPGPREEAARPVPRRPRHAGPASSRETPRESVPHPEAADSTPASEEIECPAETTSSESAFTGESPLCAPPDPPALPLSLSETVDTMEMSGGELDAEVTLLGNWLLDHAGSPDYGTLSRELNRLETELGRRQAAMLGTQDLVLEGDFAVLSQIGLGAVFIAGAVAGAAYEVRPNDLIRFASLVIANPWDFELGIDLGIIQGIGEDILMNLEGLVALLELMETLNVQGITLLIAREAAAYLTDREGYVERRTREIEAAMEIARGVAEFLAAVEENPRLLYIHSEALGREAGIRAAEWFNDDFMRRSNFERGRAIGRVSGIVLTEILLLFLGPEEWVARGGLAAGQATRLVTRAASGARRASRAALEIMESVPGLRRVLRALENLGELSRGARGARGARSARGTRSVEGAGGAGRAIEAGDDLGRAGAEGAEDLGGTGSAVPEDIPAGPIRGVIEGGGETTAPRLDHLSVVPDSGAHTGPLPDEPLPEAAVLPVPEEAEEVLDLAAGAEDLSRGARSVDPLVPRAGSGETGGSGGSGGSGGGRVIEFPGPRTGSAPSSTRGGGRGSRGAERAGVGGREVLEGAGRGLETALPGSSRTQDLLNAAGEFRAVDSAAHPELAADLERLEALYQRYLRGGRNRTMSRSEWLLETRGREARQILDRSLEAGWRTRSRRLARVERARERFPDPRAWREIEAMEEMYPALRDRDLIPVRRDSTRPGMPEESGGTNQGPYSFEAIHSDNEEFQIDGFDEIGRLVEHKSRSPGEFLERELAEMSFERRERVMEMLRDVDFARENGLPGVVWQTDDPDFADMLRAIRREEGLTDFVEIDDLSAHGPDLEIPYGDEIDDFSTEHPGAFE